MPAQALRPCSRRLLLNLTAGLLALAGVSCLAGTQPTQTARDWTTYPALLEIDTAHDVYALGDVHGDYDRLITLLVAGKIIAGDPGKPEKVRWMAGKAVLVCTGDLINKGDQALRVIALFKALQPSAKEAGGRVVVTMGNHEAAFLAHPTHAKKSAEFLGELKARGIDPKAVAAGRDALGVGAFLRNLPFAARVNDWFFAHAGNTHGRTLKRLQADLQQGIDAQGFKAAVLLDADSLLEARLHPRPWWEKAGDDLTASKKRLEAYAQALGVKHLVLGHQPGLVKFGGVAVRKPGEMYSGLDGLVFLIDVGMSRAVGNSHGALLHLRSGDKPRATAVYPKKAAQQLWPVP